MGCMTSIINALSTQTPPQRQDRSAVPSRTRLILCGILCVIFIVFIIVIGVILGCPKAPKLEVNSVIVSPFNVNGTSPITAHWDVGFLIKNRNKVLKYNYKQINVSVYYKTQFLTGTILKKPFVQHAKKQTLLNASSGVVEEQFPHWVSLSMSDDLINSSVPFNIFLNGWISPNYNLLMDIDNIWIEASCPDVTVGFSSAATTTTTTSSGTMLGGPRRCNVSVKLNPKGNCNKDTYYGYRYSRFRSSGSSCDCMPIN